MMIISRVPDLVAEKFGGKDKVNIAEVQRETGLNYRTASTWVRGKPERADFDILEVWCNYLQCEVGDLLVHVPDRK